MYDEVILMGKMSGEVRRKMIIEVLKNSTKPVTGKALADEANVSRQVIVTDVALLKTANEPIIATNRGYLYLQQQDEVQMVRRVVICQHTREQTRQELEIIVDCGVTVVDVIVAHPIYGELTGNLRVSSRYDVEQFIQALEENEAALLSKLTSGIHLHTLEADSMDKIDLACEQLKEAGLLYVEENEDADES